MPPQTAERPLAAIAAQFVCFTFISANDVILKIIVADLPSWQIMTIRSGFGILLLLPFVAAQALRGTGSILTRRPGAHLMRACLSAVSIVSYFEALRELDLPVATAILFVTPFFVVALSGIVLREPVTPNRWIAVIIGFVGAIIIIRPGPAGVSVAALLAVLSAATWGSAMVAMRNLGRTEGTLSVLFFFNLFICCIAGAFAYPGWQPVSGRLVGMIALVAAIQLIAQFFMMTAFRFASASVTAPVQYSQLLWSVAAGWFVFSVVPGPHVVLGAAVIVASGLYLILSERRPS
ncbi:MAG: DMT family transporter [Proteobacteria bacterium]|nr:DMT family transporter [Pseudomonadota bacterium]